MYHFIQTNQHSLVFIIKIIHLFIRYFTLN